MKQIIASPKKQPPICPPYQLPLSLPPESQLPPSPPPKSQLPLSEPPPKSQPPSSDPPQSPPSQLPESDPPESQSQPPPSQLPLSDPPPPQSSSSISSSPHSQDGPGTGTTPPPGLMTAPLPPREKEVQQERNRKIAPIINQGAALRNLFISHLPNNKIPYPSIHNSGGDRSSENWISLILSFLPASMPTTINSSAWRTSSAGRTTGSNGTGGPSRQSGGFTR